MHFALGLIHTRDRQFASSDEHSAQPDPAELHGPGMDKRPSRTGWCLGRILAHGPYLARRSDEFPYILGLVAEGSRANRRDSAGRDGAARGRCDASGH